ncbi:MAG TPA: hypothetical protein VL832_08040, partial [Puia sp.]|nr:hypothetical protein [Puia sp.]
MTLPLLRKRYNFHIISFILLSSFFGDVSNATPACPIITNQFQGANGTTVDTGLTGWSIDASALTTPHPTGYYFALKSNRFTATNLGGVGIVNSHVFSIAGYKSPQVSVKITAEGQQNSTEYIQFYYKLDGGAPVLVAQQNGNFGTLTFTSPVLSGNNVQLIIKIYDYNNGSGQNSNYYIERYDVFQTSGPCTPGNASISVSASASNSGAITCSNSSVTLSASSTTTGLSYFWTGPNSYASTSTSPSVSTAGTYTVIVTTSTGWGTATVNVTTNTTAPAGVTATVSGFLSCATAGVTLTGSSTTSGATFTWTGPNSFTATGATATASTAGTYTVTARNPTTGCTATASVAVTSNATAPANLTAISSGSLSCSTTSVTLTGSSSTSGITFAWTGPNGFTATGATTSVSIPGTYTVTATNPTTGCTATASTTVVQNITAPAGVTISSSNNSTVLTCSNTFISLTGSSSTPGVSYSWTGPNGFTSNAASTTAFNPGVYTLVVTNPTGGCTSAATITITQNTVAPAGITAINNGPLTCTTPIVTLTGHSSSPGVNYSWTGPNTFTASTDTASVSTAGTYTLTVTDPTNGCTASANTIIAQNTAAPAGLAITSLPATPLLTCTNTNVSLTASSTLSGAGYTWVGPNNFTSSAATITISTPGIYTVTAINTANGCTSSLASSILQNITPPANLSTVSNPLNATLTCSTNSIALTASSAVTGANYSWTGPNSFAGATATATVTSPGTYIVTATDTSNGCSSTASAIIAQNT